MATPQDEQNINAVIAKAVEAAAKGENVDQLLEAMFALLPEASKDKIKQKFAAALKQRKLRQPAVEKSDELISRSTLGRLQDMLSGAIRQATDRIVALVRAKPDVAKNIQQAASVLLKNGVRVDSVQISEADLGNLTPTRGAGVAPVRGETGRGA